MHKGPGERLGISIRGGAKGHPGNPLDKTDEGIFVSKVNEGGAAFKDGRLKVGQRILEVSIVKPFVTLENEKSNWAKLTFAKTCGTVIGRGEIIGQ